MIAKDSILWFPEEFGSWHSQPPTAQESVK